MEYSGLACGVPSLFPLLPLLLLAVVVVLQYEWRDIVGPSAGVTCANE